MTEHIFEGYGAISALSTVAFLFWGWAHHRAHHPRAIESIEAGVAKPNRLFADISDAPQPSSFPAAGPFIV